MKITLVRHATLLVELDGLRLLVDPMLGAAGTSPPIENTPNQLRNPLVELPLPAADVVAGIDGCIITHLHADHLDATAMELLPDDLPVLTQPESLERLQDHGFTDVSDDPAGWLGLDVTRTGGHHGTGEIGRLMGAVSGFVFGGLYIAGDTIWCDEVREALGTHRPRAVVLNAGGARFLEGDPITMTVDDVRRVREATDAEVIVDHLEAINHCVEPRSAYRAVPGVRAPDNGETLEL
jgi:L-ascorbate metabolism protein UlaG (beta-lactamase superfamily)